MKLERYAIIVAGGKGLRMGADIPKQFLLLHGRPVLMHTIEAFINADASVRIILVLPQDHVAYWAQLCNDYSFATPHSVAIGGSERFFSVKNGLAQIPDKDAIVAIHDGVRPLVSTETILRCYEQAEREGSAIPCVTVPDSVRMLSSTGSKPIDRNAVRLVQTPQTFRFSVLADAYTIPFSDTITDDASVLEYHGRPVHLIAGNRENIKITSPEDLKIASALLTSINSNT